MCCREAKKNSRADKRGGLWSTFSAWQTFRIRVGLQKKEQKIFARRETPERGLSNIAHFLGVANLRKTSGAVERQKNYRITRRHEREGIMEQFVRLANLLIIRVRLK